MNGNWGDVERMPAGEELDRLLHREVLDGDSADPVPPYSTDLNEARALGRAFLYLNVGGRGTTYVAFATLETEGGRLIFSEGRAATAALALCRAALSAARRGVFER